MHQADAAVRDTATLDDLDGLNKRMDTIERQFREAFPGGDWSGHRRYHDIQIEMLMSRRRLLQAVMEKSISGLVWALMIVIGLALWKWFRSQVLGS